MGGPRAAHVGGGVLQWGHGREAMDGVDDPRGMAELQWLQWGHGREAMDGQACQPERRQRDWLQWGHGREAMDGVHGRQRHAPRPSASMGPWP